MTSVSICLKRYFFPNFTLQVKKKTRVIGEISAAELQELVINFVLGVRKKNGENEPSSIRVLAKCLLIYPEKGCKFSRLNDKEFFQLEDILKKRQNNLKPLEN